MKSGIRMSIAAVAVFLIADQACGVPLDKDVREELTAQIGLVSPEALVRLADD